MSRAVSVVWAVVFLCVGRGFATGAVINVPADHVTIAAAITAASDGDEIVIADGTYTEILSVSGVDAKSLTFTGESEAGVIVQADATGPVNGVNTFTIEAVGEIVTIQTMTIRHGDYGIRSLAGQVNVLHCTVVHNGWDGTGLPAVPTAANMSEFWTTTATSGGSIRIQDSPGSEIAFNTVFENDRGIRLERSDLGRIHDNVVHTNLQSGIYLACCVSGGASPLEGPTNTIVEDNESYNNFNNGVLSIEGKTNIIRNNLVYDNWNSGVMVFFPAEITVEGNVVRNNNLFAFNGNGGNPGDARSGIDATGPNSGGGAFALKVIDNIICSNQLGTASQTTGLRLSSSLPSDGYEVTGNTFRDHEIDIHIQGQAAGTTINGNSFDGIGTGIQNDDSNPVDAAGNWWGAADGPGTVGTGSGDLVSALVEFTPFAVTDPVGALEFELRTTSIVTALDPVVLFLDVTSGREEIAAIGTRLTYDSSLLSFVSVSLGSGVPGTWDIVFSDTSTLGEIDVAITDITVAAATISGPIVDLEAIRVEFDRLTTVCDTAILGFNPDPPAAGPPTAAFPVNQFLEYLDDVCAEVVRLDEAATTETSVIVGTTAPGISCPADLTLECPTDTSPAATGMATAVDAGACVGVTITFSDVSVPGPGDTESITRTWTATDDFGNESSCAQAIAVVDTTDPTAVCKNISVDLSASGMASIIAADIDDGSSDTCGQVSLSASKTAFDCDDLGQNDVILTVTDASGNESSCTASVTVRDLIFPIITCPGGHTREANSNCLWDPPDGGGASLLGTATATDNCPAGLVISNNAPAAFGLGTTNVVWTATDAAGNAVSCDQLVVVTDETPPSLVAPADTTRSANSNCRFIPEGGGGVSTLGTPTATDNCDTNVTITNNAPSSFPLGTTSVQWVATDDAGNQTTATQLVIVIDDTAPTLSCPPDLTRTPNQGAVFVPADGGGASNLGTASATDNCDNDVTITSNAPSSFPLGTTVVEWTATDDSGNSAGCTQIVTVVDASVPEITCPPSITAETNAGCAWVGNLGTPVVTDAETPNAQLTVMNNAPGALALGDTDVLWTVIDPAGNASSCVQTVTVLDVTPPSIFCPPAVTTFCTNSAGTSVDFIPTGTDNCGEESLMLVCDPPSGSVFPPGLTTVTCTATDASGNAATCAFDVEVQCGGLVMPGDCNSDGNIDISDGVCLISILFENGGGSLTLPCEDRSATHPANVALMDWNSDQDLDLSDVIALLSWSFLGGFPHGLGVACTVIPDCPTVCETSF
jgi:hypothetical protein